MEMTDEQQAAFNDWYRENVGGAPQPGVTVAPIFVGGWVARDLLNDVSVDALRREVEHLRTEARLFIEEMGRRADDVENDAIKFGGSARLHLAARTLRQRTEEYVEVVRAIPKSASTKEDDLRKSIAWMAQTIHQAYHDDVGGTWEGCPRNTCTHAAELTGFRKRRP